MCAGGGVSSASCQEWISGPWDVGQTDWYIGRLRNTHTQSTLCQYLVRRRVDFVSIVVFKNKANIKYKTVIYSAWTYKSYFISSRIVSLGTANMIKY
jgi:hypothetical protein